MSTAVRRLIFGWAMWGVACASGGEVTPVAAVTTPAVESPAGSCVSALFLVDQNAATASAVDPVETWLGLTQSRAFSRGATPEQDPRGVLAAERIDHSALIRLKVRAEPARARAVCAFASERLLSHALEADAPAREWLQQELERRERDQQEAENALRQFDIEHNVASVGLDAQVALLRSQIADLTLAKQRGKPGLDGVLAARKEEAVVLGLLVVDREHLVRNAANAQKLLLLVQERSSEQRLAAMSRAPVRLVDACAPCEESAVGSRSR